MATNTSNRAAGAGDGNSPPEVIDSQPFPSRKLPHDTLKPIAMIKLCTQDWGALAANALTSWWSWMSGSCCLLGRICQSDAHIKPLGWLWIGQRCHGHNRSNLLHDWRSTKSTYSCRGALWQVFWSITTDWCRSNRSCSTLLAEIMYAMLKIAVTIEACVSCENPQVPRRLTLGKVVMDVKISP